MARDQVRPVALGPRVLIVQGPAAGGTWQPAAGDVRRVLQLLGVVAEFTPVGFGCEITAVGIFPVIAKGP